MTFEELCELEPELKDLHTLARMIGDKRNGKSFCANFIWYRLFKPKLYRLVGWRRRIPRDPEQYFKLTPISELLAIPEERFCNHCGNLSDDDMIKDPGALGTSDAYDLAYHTIYNQLPNCRNCGCM